MKTEHEVLTEGSLLGMIRNTYPASGYVVLDQVRSTNTSRARIADAVAMGLWKNRDLTIDGFELKVTRQAWLQELKAPAKAEEVMQYCDHWWLVAADETIIKPDELPKPWGLKVPGEGGRLRTVIEAPFLQSSPPDRVFLASLIKKILDQRLCEARQEDLDREYERGIKEGFAKGLAEGKVFDQKKEGHIEWLEEQLYQARSKNRFIEDRLGKSLGLNDAQMAAWFEIIQEVIGKFRAIRNPEQIIHLFTALKTTTPSSLEKLRGDFVKLLCDADHLASGIRTQLSEINFLKEVLIEKPDSAPEGEKQ